jgi:hypothetical protein
MMMRILQNIFQGFKKIVRVQSLEYIMQSLFNEINKMQKILFSKYTIKHLTYLVPPAVDNRSSTAANLASSALNLTSLVFEVPFKEGS